MTEGEARVLIRGRECEFLDFKQAYGTNTSEFLHDILCLSNSYHNGSKYLVFGVSDVKDVVGVEADPLRKTRAQIHDFLNHQKLNRVPTIDLHTINLDGHEIDILEIKARPDKPFFVLEDRPCMGKIVRSGAIYSRTGDVNTPINQTAKEDQIELMWRERFGIGLPPLQRVLAYLDFKEAWVEVGSDDYIYHKTFPEFTIITGALDTDDPFVEPWSVQFPDQSAYRKDVEVKYLTTILLQMTFVSCDGGRYMIPMPKIRMFDANNSEFYLIRNSHQFKIANVLFRQYDDFEETIGRIGIVIYDNQSDVPQSILS